MCGIAGIFEFDRASPADPRLLRRMTDLIAHRGPDDSGHWISGNVGLGHRRLSIIDLSVAGHQPMGNPDGTMWITYNGECYNYAALAAGLRQQGRRLRSQSDTEVILALYEQRGIAFLDAIDGMFALAIWDSRRQALILARDRIGIKPLYYFADAEHFIFASEMKALLADRRVPSAIDEAALGEYFHLLSIPESRCILKGVRKLPAGHYLTVSRRGIEERCYWDLSVDPDPTLPLEQACAEFDTRFSAAVGSHLVADVPVGAFLSGGVDSSAIVCRAAKMTSAPVETFSISFPGLPEFDESPYAIAAASHCGASHHTFDLAPQMVDAVPRVVWHADEPFAISSAFALFFLAELARQHVKVVLSGDGGDEVFAGYVWRHIDFPPIAGFAPVGRTPRSFLQSLAARAGLISAAFRQRSLAPRDDRYLRSFACFQREELVALLDPAAAPILEGVDECSVQTCLEQAPGDDQLARKLYTDIKTTLVSEMLTKVDRMTMAHGLEARVPFLDHHLVSWAFTVPSRHKLRGGEGKFFVKKALEGQLPASILHRPKQGFNVPMKVWMREDLRDFVTDHLTGSPATERGLYRRQAVANLLDDHFTGRIDASNKIFALLMLELWYRRFADRRSELLAEGPHR